MDGLLGHRQTEDDRPVASKRLPYLLDLEVARRPAKSFDHVILWNERHARQLLRDVVAYYNEDRTHLALGKNTPTGRAVEMPEPGKVAALSRVGGLHHRYTRQAA